MKRLLVFLKYPTPGRVKTRLAEAIGAEAAATIYRACVELTLERLRPLASEAIICAEPASACGSVRAWLGSWWHVHPQVGQTLGDRLAYATGEAFEDGTRRVVCIGTDSPWLQPEHIEAAFSALEDAELVLGPTEDGGYYLIGLSRPAPALFSRVAWSTPQVLAQTQANARALGLRMRMLSVGYDVDRVEDLQRFLDEERARGTSSRWLRALEGTSRDRSDHTGKGELERLILELARGGHDA